MKIGFCCSDARRIQTLHDLGYDFVEVNNNKIASMTDAQFAELLALKNMYHTDFFYACNGLVPGDIRLTGPFVDYDRIEDFSRKSFERLHMLGVQMLVFGSSKAKEVPPGFSFDEAMEQLTRVTSIFADIAATYGMRVCIEPLRYAECNIINTVEESIELAKRVGKHNVGAHVDFYHWSQNGEDIHRLPSLAPAIIHAHIASPTDRCVTVREEADYASFFCALRKGGYDATVSYEGSSGTEEEARAMLMQLKQM